MDSPDVIVEEQSPETLTRMALWGRMLAHAWAGHRWLIVVGGMTFGLLVVISARIGPSAAAWATLQNFATVLTLVVAVMIWLSEQFEQWREGLPKRLDVRFFHEGRLVMSCEGAYLAGESDIRAWSQQMGSQMAGVSYLQFHPNIEQAGPTLCRDSAPPHPCYALYQVRVRLRTMPTGLREHGPVRWNANGDPY